MIQPAPQTLSNSSTDGSYLNQTVMELALKVLGGGTLNRDEAMQLADLDHDSEVFYDLLFWANKIRIHRLGKSVHFCSIVTGKVGGCSEDCSYCSQSSHYDTHVKPSSMTVEEMESAAEEATASGANSFGVVNSGFGPTDKELDWMEPFFRKNAEEGKIRTCATLGHLTKEHAKRLWDMGVERINHNLETSERNFPNICSTHTFQQRVETIKNAKEIGMSVCAGGIFGMGEGWEDRVDMALTLRDLDVETVPINFLYAIEGTPLKDEFEPLTPREALKVIAVYRFILPDRELKIAGGREKILRDLQSWCFYAGGSSFLIGNYLTTFGRTPQQDHQLLKDLGIQYRLYDETECEADPELVPTFGPGANGVSGEEASYMVRKRGGRIASLPVVGSGPGKRGGSCCGK